jgi:membrane fusion protein (multidrug efflux system)
MSQKSTESMLSPQAPSNGEASASATARPEAFARPVTGVVASVRKPIYRRPAGIILLAVVALAGIAAIAYWLYARQWEQTDDAFLDGSIMPVGTKVAGVIQTVRVNDNQLVNAGDVLAEIDPRDIEARLAQSKATLEASRADAEAARTNVDLIRANTAAMLTQGQAGVELAIAGVATARSQLASAEADVASAQAEATRREADEKRYTSLDPRAVSQAQLDASRAADDSARAQLLAAHKRVGAATAGVSEAQAKVANAQGVLAAAQTAEQQVAAGQAKSRFAQAQVGLAQAQLDAATLDLSYTIIKSPVAGRVTRKNIEPGQYLQVGQTLLAVVPQEFWVTANFKETQLTRMRVGQPVDIHLDAFPDHIFHGRVESFQAGTGARFSLLPAENATGNYVKVVQRVPVKIVFEKGDQASQLLGLGMSVLPEVRVTDDSPAANRQAQVVSTGN